MKHNNVPAFPQPGILSADGIVSSQDYCEGGMTLRDYFAAKAMQGFAADPGCAFPDGNYGMAKCAYRWADAMLKVREEE